jgi:mitochondrial chaperone BCS1
LQDRSQKGKTTIMQNLLNDFSQGFRDALKSNPLLSGGVYLAIIGTLLALVRRIPTQAFRVIQRRFVLTVEVDSTDQSFPWLQVWLATHQETKRAKHLILRTRNVSAPAGTELADVDRSSYQLLLTPAPGMYIIRYKKRFMLVGFSRERRQANEMFVGFHETLVIRVLGTDRNIVNQLIHDAHNLAMPANERRITIRVPRVGFWNTIDTQIPRPIESLVLADNISNLIIDDIRRFVKERNWYVHMGIPWRRSYLLFGEPGNGKTSLVKAVAGVVGLDIAALSLSGNDFNDEMLLSLITSVPERSLLLLEDIDAVFTGRNRIDQSSKVTFTGLLNALDGVASRDGLIVFMTTNHKERLDPALIRPGRADLHVYLGNASGAQIDRMINRFYPNDAERLSLKLANKLPDHVLSMAQVQEQFMRWRHDGDLATDYLLALSQEQQMLSLEDVLK